MAGLGADQVRVVDVDDTSPCGPRPSAAAIAEDRAAGRTPFFCCATVGTTSSLAVDPVPALAEVVRRHGCLAPRRRRHGRARPPSARSCGGSTTGSTGPTATPSTPTSGCSPTSTAPASGWPTGRRCSPPCRSCPSTSATRPARPARSSTTGTGRSRSAAGSGPSSSGSSSATTAPRAWPTTSAATSPSPSDLVGWVEADDRFVLAAPPRLGPGVPPPRRRRRRHPGPARRRQRLRGAVPDPHPARRPPRHPGLDRPDPHRGTSRPGPLGSPHVPGRRPTREAA